MGMKFSWLWAVWLWWSSGVKVRATIETGQKRFFWSSNICRQGILTRLERRVKRSGRPWSIVLVDVKQLEQVPLHAQGINVLIKQVLERTVVRHLRRRSDHAFVLDGYQLLLVLDCPLHAAVERYLAFYADVNQQLEQQHPAWQGVYLDAGCCAWDPITVRIREAVNLAQRKQLLQAS